ncbi:dUTP pyrophosphatase [Tetraselmis virus 1]|uniref:dUTP diphosphatase n=1 Tax=Tetraselmis virus 1 TaxID=2060617 RepID=A0A2P0VP45_9VIRU|nr:dUTP pyrophosphatase [Tetraselmis virus 1]AUF82677.1 dUTP pyrophosphatase [Tetraselmis virus 1]
MSVAKVKLLCDDAKMPCRGDQGAAGFDVYSTEDAVIPKGGRNGVGTGLSMACPPNHYIRVAPRSGLAFKNGIDVLAGVIDESYRGEIKVILQNLGDNDFSVKKGDRIAQLIFEKISIPMLELVDSLSDTERGSGGFGSTGV